LEYISSAGLRVLLIASKKLGSENVVLKNLSPVVSEVIETTGFDQILTIS
jgi:anti-anti-sigma factor